MSPAGSGNPSTNRDQPEPAAAAGRAAPQAASPAIQSLYAAATQHLQAGRRDEAERLLQQVLATDPSHADSLHLLGVVAYQTGRLDLAIERIGQAIAINPAEAQYHSNLGNLLQQKGRLDAAIAAYRTALDLNPDLPGAHNNLGNALREQGLLDDATASYRRAIALRADYAEAHNNLGVALLEQGRADAAIASYRRAIELRPDYPDAYNNLGNALRERWSLDEAVASYRKALDLRPDYPEAHNNLGIALQDQGRPDDAVAALRTARDLNPGDAETHINLGLALKQQGRLDEAAACCDDALGLKPEYPEAHYNQGNVRQEQGRLDEAIASYRRAIAQRPNYAGAHVNLGNALREKGMLDEAAACYRTAVGIQPTYAEAHHNLSIVLLDQGRPDEAIAASRTAIALKPDYKEARDSLGNALRAQGSPEEAIASYRRAIELKPDYADAHGNLAMALLAQGDLAAGWEEYEWRFKTPQLAAGYREFAQPQWRGEPADGRTLLIHAEQGLGDTIQFCRYAPLAAARGLRVVLEVPRSLVRLQRSLPGVDRVLAHGEPLPPFDLHCPMLSLPLALGTTTLEAIPATVPYLYADAALAASWRDRLAAMADPGVRVGLVWAGNPRKHVPAGGALDRRRSIAPDLLAPLFAQPGVQFFSLQKDGPRPPANLKLVDLMGEVGDFADTAALVANLDLVVSVDTSVAHLAAALGKPVWLLDRFDPCWRWLTGRRDSPWYPTLTLFRQPIPGDWQSVIASVQAELATFVADHPELGAIGVDRIATARPGDTVPLSAFTDIQGLFADAVRQHRAGRLADAEQSYRQVLAAQPRHADSLHLLGVIGGQTGRHDLAADMISRAIAIHPNEASYHCNLGVALRQQGRLDAAIASFRTALDLRPDNAEAHNSLGIALGDQARPDEAIACFRRAIALDPNYLGAHANLGNALKAQGRLDEAEVCYRRAVELDPNRPGPHHNLGTALRAQGRLDAAVACFRRAIELDPAYVLAHNSLGIAFKEQARLDAAAACFRHAIELSPDFAEAHNNLGTVLGEQARQDAAIACYRQAIALSPQFAETHNNLGTALRALQRPDEAAASYRRAIELDPHYAEAHNNLAMTLLAEGDFAAGWPEYEWRWQTPDMAHAMRDFTQPQWRGEPAEGRTLLIHAEQGLGDTLHFCRYAMLVAASGSRVILEVPAPLVRLQRSLPGIDRVVPRGEALPPFDLHCPMLSLPLALGTTLATIPNAVPYLHADPTEVAEWAARLAAAGKPGRRVGLVWAGSARRHSATGAALDARRSIAPQLLAPLIAVPGLHFVSLQKDGPAAPAAFGLTDVMAGMADFADTAALIANLDLVIAVDTAVAHLAAALGKPVWLLDRFDADWRWLAGRRDSPWYPTLTLFRQPEPGNWQAVVQTVQAELNAFGAGGSACRLLPGGPAPSAGAADAAPPRRMPAATPPTLAQAVVPPELAAPAGLPPPPMAPELRPAPVPDLEGLFTAAVGHHRAGRLTDAEPLYRQVLAANPRHADSLYLRGVISGQRGDHAQAAGLIGQAIAIDPAQAAYHTNLGIALRELDRLDEAVACFRAALDLKPDDPAAHNTLGVALKGQRRLDEAIASFHQAIARKPDFAEALNNLGNALREQHQPGEAAACYRRALGIQPAYAEAHNNLGAALRDQGMLDAAAECFCAALDLKPDYAEAHNNLGTVRRDQGLLEAAVACFQAALERNPNHPAAHNNLAIALQDLGRLDEAVARFGIALALRPDDPETNSNLGLALQAQGKLHEAADCLRHALGVRPDFPEALYNLGNVLWDQERLDEAVACYRKAIELKQGYPEAHSNLGNVLLRLGRLDAAVASYRRAVELKPDYADAHTHLAMALLAQGDFAAGWVEYEWRWQTAQMEAGRRGFARPQWRGAQAEGRKLLIHAEQGFGDTVQFCRFVPLAAARGMRVIVQAPQPLVRLLRSLPGVAQVVAHGEALPQFDLHCPMLSLPLALGTTLASIPDAVPYLHADAAEAAAWGERLAATGKPGPRIGLVWAGNSLNAWSVGLQTDRRRSMAPDRLAPLFALAGLHFISLQKTGPAAPANLPLTDWMAEMDDFADTAALIANLDLVISVDTAVTHLAAALGKPVWLMNRSDQCWRWLTGRRDSPWYPTLRIYRQPQPGDWDTVLSGIVRDLHAGVLP